MRIDGNGNVGIGVETPQDRLHIAESVRLDKDVDVINDNYGRISYSADSTVDYGVRFMHYQGTAIYDSMISVGGSGTVNKNHIHFYTKGDGSSNATLSATIDDNGLGIGTDTPDVSLEIATTNPTIRLNGGF